MRVHEYLETNKDMKCCCIKCGHVFCSVDDNYKKYCKKAELTGDDYGVKAYLHDHRFVLYIEYYCPGCFTLLSQEQAPAGHEPVPDFKYDPKDLKKYELGRK